MSAPNPLPPAAHASKPNPPKRGLPRKIAVALLAMTFGLGLALCLLEVGVRVFVPVTDVAYQFGDPLIGPRRIPNQAGINRVGRSMNARYRFNAQGWNHPRDYVIRKPPGARRVCLVGDSFVEAMQIDVDKAMFCRAEAMMNRPDRPVEWLAFGCSGLGTTQEFELIRHYVLDYAPDVVVLFFVQNDPWDSSPYIMPIEPYVSTYRLDDGGELELMPASPYKPGTLRRWMSRSALVRYLVLQKRVMERLSGGSPNLSGVQMRAGAAAGSGFREKSAAGMTADDRQKKTWELIEKTLEAMRDECQSRGASLMIAFRGCEPVIEAARTGQPAIRPPKSEDPYCLGSRVQDMGPEWVEPIATRLNIPYLDLTAALTEAVKTSGKSHVFPDDSHYNEMAHETAAQAMADWIEQYWQSNPAGKK